MTIENVDISAYYICCVAAGPGVKYMVECEARALIGVGRARVHHTTMQTRAMWGLLHCQSNVTVPFDQIENCSVTLHAMDG